MARPLSMVFALNGAGPTEFKLPDVHAADPLHLPLFPSFEFFQRPADMVAGQKVTMRLNPEGDLFGQVFGYIAPKGQCILDLDGREECWMVPPSPTGYNYALQGTTILDDATELATANIGGAGGHAPHEMGWREVPRYYEDISTQMARVVYGEDEFGVWAAGIGVPTLTWGGAVTLVASATSGDWRWVDELGGWDYMGSCFVNLPGMPLHAKSGTRIARRASAVPFGDKVMIVTMSGSVTAEPETEETDMGADNGKACNCSTASEAAQTASGGEPASTTALPAAGLSAAEVDAKIAEALEARDAQWEAKIGESIKTAIEPLDGRLSSVEEISLSVLDSA